MWLIVVLSLVAALGAPTNAGCPFADSLAFGRSRQKSVDQNTADLIGKQLLITPGMPAFVAWGSRPTLENVGTYNQSLALLLAQQIHLQTCPLAAGQTAAEALHALQDEVPLAERQRAVPSCDPTYPYVQPSGICNKLSQPNEGATFTPYSRVTAAHYADGLYSIRQGSDNFALVSPRVISNRIAEVNPFAPAPRAAPNAGAIMWGQYITHDMSFRQLYGQRAGGPGLRCCTADNRQVLPKELRYFGCYPIEVPADDEFFRQFDIGCLEFIRSQPVLANDGSLGTVQISSTVTHHLDNSNVYGSDANLLKALRKFEGGELAISASGVLPKRPGCTGPGCYFTGDVRATGLPTLALWHSVCVRLHNVIARELRTVNPQWTDERLFQEARRVSMAVYQSVSYNEWAPLVLGQEEAAKRNVTCAERNAYCGWYRPEVDGSATNEWSSAAFRSMHGNTPPVVNLYNKEHNVTQSILLENTGNFGADLLDTETLGVLRGLLLDSGLFGKYPHGLRHNIFNNFNKNGIGLDLLSVDIARGRDHGLAPYAVHSERCTGRTIADWSDLYSDITYPNVKILKSLYASVADVDLFVGLLLERKHNSVLGPVGRCLIADQFYRTKHGDRFFYSLPNGANPFSLPQLASIQRFTFADVLCATTEIEAVPARAFETISSHNPNGPCSQRKIDFALWKEAA